MKWKIVPGLIALAPAVSVPLVQYLIRPNVRTTGPIGLFLGSAPDLISGFCIPFFLLIRPDAWSPIAAKRIFWASCAFTAVGIGADEYLSPFGPNVFDPNDLMAAAIGIILAILVFVILLRPRLYPTTAITRHSPLVID